MDKIFISFIKFHTAEFYSSIKKDLIEKLIKYIKAFTMIENKTLESLQLMLKEV